MRTGARGGWGGGVAKGTLHYSPTKDGRHQPEASQPQM